MAFQRPALSDLITRIRADLSSRIIAQGLPAGSTGSPNVLRRSTIGVMATVWGGALYLVYGFLAWIANQVIPDTATAEYIDRWASIKGLTRIAAVFQRGTVSFPTSSDPLTIPQGALMQANDGTQYSVDSLATSAAGACVTSVTCLTSGSIGQRAVNDVLTLLSPITGITSAGTWQTTTQTGTDTETDSALQSRMLTAFQTPPQGGALADYLQWALQVAGVTRAWVFANYLGAGTVGITFVRDNDGTGSAIIPNAGSVSAVQSYITDPTRAPVTANPTVYAPTGVTQNFTIHLNPDTTALRTAVTAALTNLVYREAYPGNTMYLTHVQAAIREAIGTGTYTLTTPNADQVFTNAQVGIMGTVTWT